MVKTLVVPLDGSPLAERALEPARWLASALDADVRLITATLAPDLEPSERYLASKAAAFGVEDTTGEVLPMIFPAPGIIRYCDSVPEPLVVMATHGHSGLGALVLGSVAELVVRDVSAPVMFVGPECRPIVHDAATPAAPMVLCWDGSEASTAMVPVAGELAAALGIDVRLVTVRTPETDEYGLAVSAALQSRLDAVATRLRSFGPQVQTEVLDSPSPATAIVSYASLLPASMIATATHGHTGLLRSPLGSVAMKIVQLSTCPVVVRRSIARRTGRAW